MPYIRCFCLLLLFPLLIACNERQPASVGGIEVPAALLMAADEESFDYTGYLNGALHGDSASFRQLFLFCKNVDETALPAHGQVLRAVIGKIGDAQFSQQIGPCREDDRLVVWGALEMAPGKRLLEIAPQTWAAVLPSVDINEYRGLYVFDRKMSTFRDCAEPGRRYLAIDETGEIELNYLRLLGKPYPGEALFAKLKGLKTDVYANLELPADFAGFFIVTEMLELEAKNYRNTCVPYELWAIGTEPFWQVQVSANEGVIEFRQASSDATKYFPYFRSVEQDTATLISSVNESTGDNIYLMFKEAPCSDGMSDTRYGLQVTVTVNGVSYSGCGIPFGGG